MDAQAVLTSVVAGVARDLLSPEELSSAPSDDEVAEAFHAAVGAMDPIEYEDLLLTLPADALRALAVAGYVTTTHLLYACGARGEVPDGVGEYLGTVLFALPDGEALERFLGAAWFGYAYGATTKNGLGPAAEPTVLPACSAEAMAVLKAEMMAAGHPAERADALLEKACRLTEDSRIALPEAYVHAGTLRPVA